MARDLRDKVIVITGASSGIGAATAKRCHAAGMKVVAAARRVDRLVDLVAPMGERGLAVACDVDRDEDVEQLFATAVEKFGRVDAVFANAGYGHKSPVETMDDAQVRAIFETNFHGTLRCVRVGLPLLRNTQGHLLICSSAASEIGIPCYGVYAATKAAQKSIAQALRGELRGQSVYVTTVHPVGTRTEFFDTAAKVSGTVSGHTAPTKSNTPQVFEQTADKVAKAVVKALRRPKPEVWPMPAARFGLAVMNMFPRLSAWALRHRKVQV